MNVEHLIGKVKRWAAGRVDIVGVALVGSHARGVARPDSDVDLVLLCADPELLTDTNWISEFGQVRSFELEDYGALQSVRVHYQDAVEVEFGIADRSWARIPLDPGTRKVLVGGVRILYDPELLLRAAIDATGA